MTAAAESAREPDRLDDAVLVRRYQAGELQAYADLVRKYQDRIYNTCWRICGQADDARDLTQDVFLKALESIQSFRGRSAFYTWVFRIAVNMAISHKRRMTRRRETSLDAARPGGETQAAGLFRLLPDDRAADPSDQAVAGETHRHVAAALAGLDDEHRAVLVLRDVEGLDYQHIADVLEIAVGTVKSRIYRGRCALRQALASPEERERA